MQPTKKRAIAKCVITAAAIGIGCATAAEASAYQINPATMTGEEVNTSVATRVTTSVLSPNVSWVPREVAATTRPVALGTLQITTPGIAGAPAAYLIGPCNGAADYTLTINDEETGEDYIVTLNNDAPLRSSDRKDVIDANSDLNHSATVEVKVNKAPVAGEYRTCVGVTALADEPMPY